MDYNVIQQYCRNAKKICADNNFWFLPASRATSVLLITAAASRKYLATRPHQPPLITNELSFLYYAAYTY